MSARPGIVVDVRTPADGGESPNRYDPAVSIHVRAYWPPLATTEEIDRALWEAFARSRVAIAERRKLSPAGWPL